MKKLICLLVACLLICGLAACVAQENTTASTDDTEASTTAPTQKDEQSAHTHNYGQWKTSNYLEDSYELVEKRVCADCGHVDYLCSNIEELNIDLDKMTFEKDEEGNLLTGTYEGEEVTLTCYYQNNEKVKEVYEWPNHQMIYEFDDNGRLSGVMEETDRYSYEHTIDYKTEGQICFTRKSLKDDTYREGICELDERGNVVKVTSRSYDGNELQSSAVIDMTYDAADNKTKAIYITYNENNDIISHSEHEYEYDAKGYVTRHSFTDYKSNGKINQKYSYEYEYDDRGNKIKEVNVRIHYSNGYVTGKTVYEYEYNENGSLTRDAVIWCDADGNETAKDVHEYEYDGDGHKTRETYTSYNADNDTFYKGSTEYEYDANGNMIRETEQTYDRENNLIKYCVCDKDRNYTYYDAEGNEVDEDTYWNM